MTLRVRPAVSCVAVEISQALLLQGQLQPPPPFQGSSLGQPGQLEPGEKGTLVLLPGSPNHRETSHDLQWWFISAGI